jgi:paraquat-inducible protein A
MIWPRVLPMQTTLSIRPLVCHDCDALLATPELEEGEKAICPRCVGVVITRGRNSLHRTAAFAMASAVLFVVANSFPFLTLRAGFRENQMLLWQSATGLGAEGYPYLAAAVSIFIVAAPALLIGGLLYIILPLLRDQLLPGAIPLCRWVFSARRWSMMEVFLVGVLVSLMKVSKLATLMLGTSFWAFVALIICLTAALASIHPRELWGRIEVARR